MKAVCIFDQKIDKFSTGISMGESNEGVGVVSYVLEIIGGGAGI